MRFDVRPETQLGPGPYSVYVDDEYLITVDTKVEVEQVKTEERAKVTAGDANPQ